MHHKKATDTCSSYCTLPIQPPATPLAYSVEDRRGPPLTPADTIKGELAPRRTLRKRSKCLAWCLRYAVSSPRRFSSSARRSACRRSIMSMRSARFWSAGRFAIQPCTTRLHPTELTAQGKNLGLEAAFLFRERLQNATPRDKMSMARPVQRPRASSLTSIRVSISGMPCSACSCLRIPNVTLES